MAETSIVPMGRTTVDQDLFDKYVNDEGRTPECGISGQPITVGDEVEMQEVIAGEDKPYYRMVLVSVIPKEKSMEDILGDEDDAAAAAEGESNGGI